MGNLSLLPLSAFVLNCFGGLKFLFLVTVLDVLYKCYLGLRVQILFQVGGAVV